MAENSKIQWTDHTFNPWWGCTKVHEGCTHCYAEAFSKRTGRAKWGDAGTRVMTSPKNWRTVLKWNIDAEASGERKRVFCASMADVFEDWQGDIHDWKGRRLWVDRERPLGPEGFMYESAGYSFARCRPARMSDVRAYLFSFIDNTPWLDWLLLTKRPENIGRMWPTEDDGAGGKLADAIFGGKGKLVRRRDNVWLGTSVSSQESTAGIEPLLKRRDLAPVLFLSAEPLLGPIDLWSARYPLPTGGFGSAFNWGKGINWVIVGGESGGGARPCDIAWIRAIVAECKAGEAACFVKQLGSNPVFSDPMKTAHWSHRSKGGDLPSGQKICAFVSSRQLRFPHDPYSRSQKPASQVSRQSASASAKRWRKIVTASSAIKRHGGKAYMANRIRELFPPHTRYCETHFGSGAVLLAGDGEGVAEYANDKDELLQRFWFTMADKSLFEDFRRIVEATPFCEPRFYSAKERIKTHCENGPFPRAPVEIAVDFFVRNRQSRQALGKDFATPTSRLRRNMNEQVSAWLSAVDGLPEIHARLRRVEIRCMDAVDFIRELDSPEALFYCDPPYMHETRTATKTYEHEMTEQQHAELLNALAKIEGKFILSGYPNRLYDQAERDFGWRHVDFEIDNKASSAKVKEKKIERVWMNYDPPRQS